tara:strand:- start:12 stop:290 length:279 start_codon:yes stop_codon:yes gene_type:complete
MQCSQNDSISESDDAMNRPQNILEQEQKQLQELGEERRRNDLRIDATDSQIDRPDLELNYQGNSLVIDMSRIEWIALAIIILSVASTIYLLR